MSNKEMLKLISDESGISADNIINARISASQWEVLSTVCAHLGITKDEFDDLLNEK